MIYVDHDVSEVRKVLLVVSSASTTYDYGVSVAQQYVCTSAIMHAARVSAMRIQFMALKSGYHSHLFCYEPYFFLMNVTVEGCPIFFF